MGSLTRPCECGTMDIMIGEYTATDEASTTIARGRYGPYCPDCKVKRTGRNSPNSGLFKLVAAVVIATGLAAGWFSKDGYNHLTQQVSQVYHSIQQDERPHN